LLEYNRTENEEILIFVPSFSFILFYFRLYLSTVQFLFLCYFLVFFNYFSTIFLFPLLILHLISHHIFFSYQTPARPEFRFSASSPVLCARFHTQDPHLVLGGCYSGQSTTTPILTFIILLCHGFLSHSYAIHAFIFISLRLSPS
jgi:hypothetical protein